MDGIREIIDGLSSAAPEPRTYNLWCSNCRAYFDMAGRACPSCGLPVVRFRCGRCGYEWTPRNLNTMPVYCPGCKSRYWCVKRTRSAPKGVERMPQPAYRVDAVSVKGAVVAMEKFENLAEAEGMFGRVTDPETTPLLAYGGGTATLSELHRGDWLPVSVRTVVP